MYEIVTPEFVVVVFDEFNKRDQQTPRMWSVDDQSFQQNPTKENNKRVKLKKKSLLWMTHQL